MGLEKPTEGKILFETKDITCCSQPEHKLLCQRIQMVFQDPYESLNPTQTISEIVAEPLEVHNLASSKLEREARVTRALEDAILKPVVDYLHHFPHDLSGGQRQRVVIAGTLVLEPILLLADEPVSMLDVSIRAEILNLLAELRQNRQISVIFIKQDLGTVGYYTYRIAVMYLGRIVEIGPTQAIPKNPQHPYTKALLSVIPVPNPRLRQQRLILQGETPFPIHLPNGCRFHPRCPWQTRPGFPASHSSRGTTRRGGSTGKCRSRRREWPAYEYSVTSGRAILDITSVRPSENIHGKSKYEGDRY